ncbi:MAG: hypothetical protein ABIW34_05825 [Ginsengibacter sp.]
MSIQKILPAIILLFLSSTVTAQLKTWNWSDYKMQFKAPVDFKIDENTAEKFAAGNGKLYLTIYPKKGAKMSYEGMRGALRDWSRQNDLTYKKDVQYMSNLNRYWGVYIDGVAPSKLPTTLLLLVDPDYSNISFYVWLQYQSDSLDTAVEILKSFMPK